MESLSRGEIPQRFAGYVPTWAARRYVPFHTMAYCGAGFGSSLLGFAPQSQGVNFFVWESIRATHYSLTLFKSPASVITRIPGVKKFTRHERCRHGPTTSSSALGGFPLSL